MKQVFTDSNCTCTYEILSQNEEARLEFQAAKSALDHAIDIPLAFQRGAATAGNLAWGSGSTQGLIYGGENGEVLYLTVGLKKVQKALKEKFPDKIQIDSNGEFLKFNHQKDVRKAYQMMRTMVDHSSDNGSVTLFQSAETVPTVLRQ
eukprot:m.7689 g.7689  ORF g.7689 m.7689 type:complete len:148 (+) comp3755_c0_seq1:2844-3287(+)